MSTSQKRKNKKKYFQPAKKFKGSGLQPGMKGFLISCNDEHRCVKEAYNLLNEFADEIYGPEFEQAKNEYSENIDIKEQLAKEISAMKSERRFQQVFTKAKGTIFIKTTIPDPTSIVKRIFETVVKTGKKKTRFIFKLKPVVVTCKANETDIRKALDDILLQYSPEDKERELTYKVECKVIHNDNLTSSHAIWYVRDSVKSVVPKWTACIIEPKIIISFYVLRSVCCISILDKYEEYKKYNLSIVAEPTVTVKNTGCHVSAGDTKVPETKTVNEVEDDSEVPCENDSKVACENENDSKVPCENDKVASKNDAEISNG